MKAIYAKDIKAMVKQFDLNEAESGCNRREKRIPKTD